MYIWKFTLVVVFFICSLICGPILNLNSNHKMSKTATCVPSSLMEITAGRELLQAFKKLISFWKCAVFFFFSVHLTCHIAILRVLGNFLGMTQVWRLGTNSEKRGNILIMPEFIHFVAFLKFNMLIFFSGKSRLAQRSQERLNLLRK